MVQLQVLAIADYDRWEVDEKLEPGDLTRNVSMDARFQGTAFESTHEYVLPVRSKQGRLLHLHAAVHRAKDQTPFIEARLANDAIWTDVQVEQDRGLLPGYQKLTGLWLAVDGKTLFDTKALAQNAGFIELFDQTSLAWAQGAPLALHSPRLDAHPLIEDYTKIWASWDAARKAPVLQALRQWWSKRDVRGEDHWGHTQDTGSPGAKYRDYRLLAYVAWRACDIETDVYRSTLRAAHHFILEQYGSVFEGENGWLFVPGRNYHLHEYIDMGEGRHVCLPFERKDWPITPIYQGAVQIRKSDRDPIGLGVETLGRKYLPVHDVRENGYDEDQWIGKRMVGFQAHGSGFNCRGRNGYDAEHDFRHHFHELFVFTPSVFARNSLANMYETMRPALFNRQYEPQVAMLTHSSRACAWPLSKLALLYWENEVSRPAYAQIIRDQAQKAVEHVLRPEFLPAWCQDFILSRSYGHLLPSDAEWGKEAMWQASVAGQAACDWLLIEQLQGSPNTAPFETLLKKAWKVLDDCWSGELGGFYENIQRFKDQRTPVQDNWNYGGIHGTRHWGFNVRKTDPDATQSSDTLWEKYRAYGGTDGYKDHNRRAWEWMWRGFMQ